MNKENLKNLRSENLKPETRNIKRASRSYCGLSPVLQPIYAVPRLLRVVPMIVGYLLIFCDLSISVQLKSVYIDPKDSTTIIGISPSGSTQTILTINQVVHATPELMEAPELISTLQFSAAILSPNQDLLAFSIPGHLHGYGGILNIQNQKIEPLKLEGNLYWSGLSDQLVIEKVGGSGLTMLVLHDFKHKELKRIYSQNENEDKDPVHISTISWSSDGTKIHFATHHNKTGKEDRWQVDSAGNGLKRE